MLGLSSGLMNSSSGGTAPAPIIIPEATWSANFPKAQALAVPAGFATLPAQGFMMVRFVATTVGTAVNQYALSLHNGASVNSLSMRILTDDTQRIVNNNAGVDNSNLSTLKSTYKAVANEVRTLIYTWDAATNRQAWLADGIYGEDLTKTGFTGQAFSTLQIGSRWSNGEPLLGYLVAAELGNVALSKEQMAAKAYQSAYIVIAGGQSNASNLFSNTFTASGFYGLKGAMPALVNNSREILFLNGATGSTSILKANNGGAGYWWDETSNARGPALNTFYNQLTPLGLTPSVLFWSQGESDASGNQSKEEYKTQLLKIFSDIRISYPKIRIVIEKLARRNAVNAYAPQYQNIAEAQQEIIDAYSWVLGQEIYDQAMSDNLHKDTAGYTVSGQRTARNIARAMGVNVAGGTKGPKILTATRSGAVVTVTLQHDSGTDFAPTTGIDGFAFFDGDVPVTIAGMITTSGVFAVKFNHVDHGRTIGDRLTFPTPFTYNGITVYGSYEVSTVNDANNFSVVPRQATAATASGTSGAISVVYNKKIAISSAVRASATTATVTLAATPAVSPGTLYYAYDAMLGINAANILKDNGANALPMRRSKATVI